MPKKRAKKAKFIVAERIKYEYGTIDRFCRVEGINISTFKQVVYLGATSRPMYKKLKKLGLCNSYEEMSQKVEDDA